MTRTVWVRLRLLGGAAIIALLMWRLGTGAFLDGLRVIDAGTLLAAFGIGVTTTVFSAWRWCLVARGLGLRLPFAGAVADYYTALFLNAALPGGVLGDVDRAVRHGKDSGDVGRGVRAVVLERTAGQIVLVAVGVTVLLTVPSPVSAPLERHGSTLAAVGAAVTAVAVVALLSGRRLRRGTSRAARAARTGLAEVRTGLLARRSWPGVLLASAVVLAGHLATFVVAARAAGSSAPVLSLVPLMLLALLAMVVPLNVGGWGPREGVTAWAFAAVGMSATQGLTVAVVYGLLAFTAALPGAVVLVARAAARARARHRAAALLPVAALPAPLVVPLAPVVPAVARREPVVVASPALVPAYSGA